jgi:hypothetical protein
MTAIRVIVRPWDFEIRNTIFEIERLLISKYQNGKENINQPAKTERMTNEPRRIKKYLMRSHAPFLAMNDRTSEVRILKTRSSVK